MPRNPLEVLLKYRLSWVPAPDFLTKQVWDEKKNLEAKEKKEKGERHSC